MKLKYRFNFKNKAIYGIIGFVLAAVITYFFGGINWVVAVIVGIGNFLSFGIYTDEKCK